MMILLGMIYDLGKAIFHRKTYQKTIIYNTITVWEILVQTYGSR